MDNTNVTTSQPPSAGGSVGGPRGGGGLWGALTPMETSFVITGILFALSVILGIIYVLLYHTHFVFARRKNMDGRQTLNQTRRFREGRGGVRKGNTKFGMMKYQGKK